MIKVHCKRVWTFVKLKESLTKFGWKERFFFTNLANLIFC